ncbi:NAD(P)/FAD-dependent oxidoreductase [Geminicoccus roseus]|uniref:NAD(P)/FAD-dependent oxidoreductase n=1 Tax=Geminicoccus roseus TaxID=404900 RepID=UPI000689014D|nr:FAD-binding oxidoreductase [Geminicoccus roseus]
MRQMIRKPSLPETLLADDFREEPYWWAAASPKQGDGSAQADLPRKADVAIIGGGITGMVAALDLARAGAEVVVLDAQDIGEGAARRSAGFLGRTLKRSVDWLAHAHGRSHAVQVYRELDAALKGVAALVEAEGIDCHHTLCGRFVAANSPAHFRAMIADLEAMRREVGFDYMVVEKHEQHREIVSDRYFGGAVIPDLGSIHPGLYHEGLVRRAQQAGARLHPFTAVERVQPGEGPKRITTSRGSLTAREVVVATNGYTSRGLGWHARRVIPFRGFIIATEMLPAGLIERVLPRRRTYLDTRINIDFIRPAPDSNRILFGGSTGTPSDTAMPLAATLRDRLVSILPDLGGVRLSRAWTGQCAGTFDFMPHVGKHDGVHFGLGYNFAGIPIGTHFGRLIARRILGRPHTPSVFETSRFPTAPFYSGSPWFVPLAMRYFDWHDKRIAAEHGPGRAVRA